MRFPGYAPLVGPYVVACPFCKAEPGRMCQGGRGWPKRNVQPHAPRMEQMRAKEHLERQSG